MGAQRFDKLQSGQGALKLAVFTRQDGSVVDMTLTGKRDQGRQGAMSFTEVAGRGAGRGAQAGEVLVWGREWELYSIQFKEHRGIDGEMEGGPL